MSFAQLSISTAMLRAVECRKKKSHSIQSHFVECRRKLVGLLPIAINKIQMFFIVRRVRACAFENMESLDEWISSVWHDVLNEQRNDYEKRCDWDALDLEFRRDNASFDADNLKIKWEILAIIIHTQQINEMLCSGLFDRIQMSYLQRTTLHCSVRMRDTMWYWFVRSVTNWIFYIYYLFCVSSHKYWLLLFVTKGHFI